MKKTFFVFILLAAAMLCLLSGSCFAEGLENLRVYWGKSATEFEYSNEGLIYNISASDFLDIYITGMEGDYPYRLTLSGLSEIKPEYIEEGFTQLPRGYFVGEEYFTFHQDQSGSMFDGEPYGNVSFETDLLSPLKGKFGPYLMEISCGEESRKYLINLSIRKSVEDPIFYYDILFYEDYDSPCYRGQVPFLSADGLPRNDPSSDLCFLRVRDGETYYGVQGGTLEYALYSTKDRDEAIVELREAATGELIYTDKGDLHAGVEYGMLCQIENLAFRSGAEYELTARAGKASETVRFTLVEEPTPKADTLKIRTLDKRNVLVDMEKLNKDGTYTVYTADDQYAHFVISPPDMDYPWRLKIYGTNPEGETVEYAGYFMDTDDGGQEYGLHTAVYIASKSGVYGPCTLEISSGDRCFSYNVEFNVQTGDPDRRPVSILDRTNPLRYDKVMELYPDSDPGLTLALNFPEKLLKAYAYDPDEAFYGRPGYAFEIDIWGCGDVGNTAIIELRESASGQTMAELEKEVWGGEEEWNAYAKFILPDDFASGEYDVIVSGNGKEIGSHHITLTREPDAA